MSNKYYQLGGENIPYINSHLGGTCAVPNGGTTTLTLPSGVTSVWFNPEGGNAYYSVNTASAGTASMGYGKQDTTAVVPECNNISAVYVYAAAGVAVHVQYYGG